MKALYWKAHNLPRLIVISLSVLALVGMLIVEVYKERVLQRHYSEKIAAVQLTQKAFTVAKALRRRLGIPINLTNDPQHLGLIGEQLTDITTDQGVLASKQTSVNPNIAGIFVDWLKQLDLEAGDVVAVGTTGSFPALNIAMLAAIKTLGLRPLLVYSAGASQYGANIPNFTWLDIQHELAKRNIFDYPVLGVSLGGSRDQAYGMSEKGKTILLQTIKKYNLPFLNSQGTIDGINKRMGLYLANTPEPIKAYINIGGGVASVGLKQIAQSKQIKSKLKLHSFPTGVIRNMPISLINTDSVSMRFLKQGVPAINLRNVVNGLRLHYNLPRNPSANKLAIGEGNIFFHKIYNKWLAATVLAVLVIALVISSYLSRKYLIRYVRLG